LKQSRYALHDLSQLQETINSLVKNTHLRRFPHLSLLRRTFQYASRLMISEVLHLGVFDQPEES
jgi:hypothetical protein